MLLINEKSRWCPQSKLWRERALFHAHGTATQSFKVGWLRGTVRERRSLASELSLSCARPAADGSPLMWVNHPLQVSQLDQLSLSSFRGR